MCTPTPSPRRAGSLHTELQQGEGGTEERSDLSQVGKENYGIRQIYRPGSGLSGTQQSRSNFLS